MWNVQVAQVIGVPAQGKGRNVCAPDRSWVPSAVASVVWQQGSEMWGEQEREREREREREGERERSERASERASEGDTTREPQVEQTKTVRAEDVHTMV